MAIERWKRWKVIFDVSLPDGVTQKEVEEWIGFELGIGSLSGKNPLNKRSPIDPIPYSLRVEQK